MRRILTSALAGLLLALLVVGAALLPTLHPALTAALVERYASPQEASLSPARMLVVAESVRGFVVNGRPDSLPARVDGRPGFDDGAVSHLRDVRDVLFRARVFLGVLLVLAAVWLGRLFAARRFAELSTAMMWGCGFTLGVATAAGVAATADFSSTFAVFHSLFFSAGTWTFAEGTLLIQLFPAEYWSAMGAIWGGLAVVLGAVLGVAGWLLRRAERSRA